MNEDHKKARQTLADCASFCLLVAAAGAIMLAAFYEFILSLPLPVWLYFLVGVVGFLGTVLIVALDATKKRTVGTFVAYSLAIAILMVLHLMPWTSRKPFMQQLAKVQIGMTQAEVDQIMDGYMRGTGWPANPFADVAPLTEVSSGTSLVAENSRDGELTIRDTVVFRHSNDGRFNSDWGVVTFRDDKVISVVFMPD